MASVVAATPVPPPCFSPCSASSLSLRPASIYPPGPRPPTLSARLPAPPVYGPAHALVRPPRIACRRRPSAIASLREPGRWWATLRVISECKVLYLQVQYPSCTHTCCLLLLPLVLLGYPSFSSQSPSPASSPSSFGTPSRHTQQPPDICIHLATDGRCLSNLSSSSSTPATH